MTELPPLTAEQIETALRAALPPSEQHRAMDLAHTLASILVSDVPNLRALAGREVSVSGGIIFFGSGNQFGDVIFKGDIAGGHIIRVSLTLPPPPPIPSFQVSYPQNPLFRGRSAELLKLEQVLLSKEKRAVTILPAVIGVGGIGKTQLASEFAHYYRDRFPGGIFWLNMEQHEGVASRVAAIGGPGGLGLPGWEVMDFETRVAAVQRAWNEEVARLLVLDNLEDTALLQTWCPRGGGTRVLITSRRGVWPATTGVLPIRLQGLARPESIRLLLVPRAIAKEQDVEMLLTDMPTAVECNTICEQLGDLPLALVLAGAYLEAYPSLSLESYRIQLKKVLLSHLSLQTELREQLQDPHTSSVAASITLSYKRLDIEKPVDMLALMLLHRASMLAPTVLPRRLLVRIAERNPDDEVQAVEMDTVLRRLATIGLIDLLPTGEALIHRLVAAFMRSQQRDELKDAMMIEKGLSEELEVINAAGYPLVGQVYVSHIQAFLRYEIAASISTIATLYTNVGLLLRAQGNFAEAGQYLEQALTIREQEPTLNGLNLATSLDNLGSLLQDQGSLEKACTLFERALALREHEQGLKHPDTAKALNNLGLLLKHKGSFVDARRYYERALTIHEQVDGPVHPDTATTLNNIGALLQAQEQYTESCLYYERSLAIREQALGSNHPETGASLNNMGALLKDMGDLAGARAFLERALKVWEQAFGPIHPDTALGLNNLGMVLRAQGNLVEAQSCIERALEIFEQTVGEFHSLTAASLNSLGYLARAEGNLPKARVHFERALKIVATIFGSDHPTVNLVRSNIASVNVSTRLTDHNSDNKTE